MTIRARASSKAFSSRKKIAAYMFGPRDDFQTWGWAMKRKLLCPPESLKIISRTKHVCQDFVLQTKKTLEDSEDIFRPRFPVVQYFINFQRGFETSHSTPFSRMNFVYARVRRAKSKIKGKDSLALTLIFLHIITSKRPNRAIAT